MSKSIIPLTQLLISSRNRRAISAGLHVLAGSHQAGQRRTRASISAFQPQAHFRINSSPIAGL